jgi:hypothetical protein
MTYSKITALDTSGPGSPKIVTSSRKDLVFILYKIANFTLLILSLEHRHLNKALSFFPAAPRPAGPKVINLL